MLIPLKVQPHLSELGRAEVVSAWLRRVFDYTADDALPGDEWPTRAELEAEVDATGRIAGDCDDHAFAAVFALADLGVKARVMLVWTREGGYHAVCETEAGWVLDNRHPQRVLVWSDREICDYTRDKASGFFEFGEAAQWNTVKAIP
jgi:transglutaminase-like putative cysteine protease